MKIITHKSTKWLIWEIGAVILIRGYIRSPSSSLLFSYQWHKLLHILGAILLVGNIVITGVWMFMAERTINPDVMRFAVRMVNWADVFFTVPGIFLIAKEIFYRNYGAVFFM